MDGRQQEQVRGRIERARRELNRISERMVSGLEVGARFASVEKEQENRHAQPGATERDSGDERAASQHTRDIARAAALTPDRTSGSAIQLHARAGDPAEKAEPYRQQIRDLLGTCKGNLVQVHEELTASGALLSYQPLTAFCRRQGIGQTPIVPAGRYHFEPGVELQHDTSPHEVEVGGKKYKAQTASAVLCYSRLLFFQINPTFQRFDCKVFLTDALRYIGGVPKRVMIDNTHVVVMRGTGREMIPVPEMEAFAERFGFNFIAHERGDANRSARVERPFSFIEHNFLAGRTFTSWNDLNNQARQWCDRVNGTYKKNIRAVPRELFVVERLHLKPLPAWIPEFTVCTSARSM